MTTVIVPTNHKEIADSLYAIKEQLPDGHYLQLMNMLGGKNDVPDITNAKFVELNMHIFHGKFDDDSCDIHTFVKKVKRFYKVIYSQTEEQRQKSHDDGIHEDDVNQLSDYALRVIISSLKRNEYTRWKGETIKVYSIKVFHNFDDLVKNE